MKQLAVWGVKMVWVAILLLKLVFAFGFPQSTSSANFTIEFSEYESEDIEKLGADEFDEIFQESLHRIAPRFSCELFSCAYLAVNAEAHIREIVPPPPQG
jgi:hypothetical protein